MEIITAPEAWKVRENKEYLLLDVRDEHETTLDPFKNFTSVQHIPMQRIPECLDKLDDQKNIIVACHSGGRSALVCHFLRDNGFDAYNLVGGIVAWSSLPKTA